MKYLTEYRDPKSIQDFAQGIRSMATRTWTIMEICGGQTHSIIKYGLDQLLADTIHLVHGPGCPVCVTPISKVDAAIAIARQPDTILCSYGDMLRVPGSRESLLEAKASGGAIRIVHSPLECLSLAEQWPQKQIVFFAVGFETTAPAHAMLVHLARQRRVRNLSLLVSHVLVPPALRFLLAEKNCPVEGLLAAGHVCTVVGFQEYHRLAKDFSIPIVVTGFEPLDILEGLARCVSLLEANLVKVENQYSRSVTETGNRVAQELLSEIFTEHDSEWRGLGTLPSSGWVLRDSYQDFDAERRFGMGRESAGLSNGCRASDVLKGSIKPKQCPYFGTACSPERPLGAPMVSTEGACAAYFQYGSSVP